MTEEDRNEVLEFVLGFIEAIGVVIVMCIPLVTLLVLGVLQLLYVIPRAMWLARHQRWSKMKGVITAAVIVFFLNGGCWLMIFSSSW